MRTQARSTHIQVTASNVTPIWLLPFWRLVKGEAMGDYRAAYNALPRHLPPSVSRPTVEDLAIALAIHGLA